MASPDEEADNVAAAAAAEAAADDGLTYDDNPLVDGELEQELNPGSLHNPDIPSSSSKQLKQEKQEAERKENEDGTHNNLKSTLLFSGAVIAIVGTVFAILKKLENSYMNSTTAPLVDLMI